MAIAVQVAWDPSLPSGQLRHLDEDEDENENEDEARPTILSGLGAVKG